jgi:hypothetical protein
VNNNQRKVVYMFVLGSLMLLCWKIILPIILINPMEVKP